MYIGHRNQEYEYFMDGKLLNKVENEIDIGVKIDNSMKPGAQCREASRVTMAVLNQISGAFHYPDRITFLNLYKTYVRVHLEFSTPAWNPWQSGDINVLEKVQKEAVISGLKGVMR